MGPSISSFEKRRCSSKDFFKDFAANRKWREVRGNEQTRNVTKERTSSDKDNLFVEEGTRHQENYTPFAVREDKQTRNVAKGRMTLVRDNLFGEGDPTHQENYAQFAVGPVKETRNLTKEMNFGEINDPLHERNPRHEVDYTQFKVADLEQANPVTKERTNLKMSDRQGFTNNPLGEGDNINQEKHTKVIGTWQSKISDMYDTKELSDVRFLLNGRVFEAHRFLLVMRSKEFARILLESNAANEYIIDEEVTETGFEILLRFVYKNILDTSDKQSIIETYRSAQYYGVEDLMSICVKEIMSWEIPIEEVCRLLNSGLNIPAVREKCLDLIRKNDQIILSSSSFLEINLQTLRIVLESEVLSNVPVSRLIERVMQWGVHHYGEDTDYSVIRNKLLESDEQPLLGRLQFQNLKFEELSYIVSRYRGLLTPEEVMYFLNYPHRNKDASTLPPWCILRNEKH